MCSARERLGPTTIHCSCKLRKDHRYYNFSFRCINKNTEQHTSYQHCRHRHCHCSDRRRKVLHISHMDRQTLSQLSAGTDDHCLRGDCLCSIRLNGARCEHKTANITKISNDMDYSLLISLNTNASTESGSLEERTSLMRTSSVNAASSTSSPLAAVLLLKSLCLSVSRSSHTLHEHIMASLTFLLCFVILSSQGASTYSTGRTLDFGIVIDAGSSGSRVRIYGWMYTRPGDIPQFREAFNHKVRPGISAFNTPEKDLSQLDAYIGNLLQEAKNYIPYSQRERTPIFVMATAGKSDVIFITVLPKFRGGLREG